MMSIVDEVTRDYDRVQALVNILIERATGSSGDEAGFQELRGYFVSDRMFARHVPVWLVTNRTLDQFWQFISKKSSTYAGRKEYLWKEFEGLHAYCENCFAGNVKPEVEIGLEVLDSESINLIWEKALDRLGTDPEGAITAGKTLLESACKHILDQKVIGYSSKADFQSLYRLVSDCLNMSPEQHSEQVFKQILGGCLSVVNGLGALRNRFGDAHGQGFNNIRPSPRHARLVVNLAGTMALFLIETANKDSASK